MRTNLMMSQAIRDFPKQFQFEPVVENAEYLRRANRVIVDGMGGSHLAADLLCSYSSYLDIYVFSNYGLPPLSDEIFQNSLLIASSYSGNTEEVIDFFQKALEKKYSLAVISVGGKLIELAKKYTIPYVQMPNTGIQPRSGLGFSMLGLMKLMGDDDEIGEMKRLTDMLDVDETEKVGRSLAQELHGKVPIIYSSQRNLSMAYNWKIKLNETGKIPAFYNIFPELNHNELNSFDVIESTRALSERFYFIFLRDSDDHPRILKRMEVTQKMYEGRGFPVKVFDLEGDFIWYKVFSCLLVADWTAFYTAEGYGAESEKVPMVEEFKRLIK